MASAPAYAVTPRIGVATVSTANTNRDGTGTIVDALTGVAAGTRVERIRIVTTSDPADSIVTMFLYDGSTYQFYKDIDIGNPAAASTTVGGVETEITPGDLVLPSASWKVAFAITVALTGGVMKAFVHGADLT